MFLDADGGAEYFDSYGQEPSLVPAFRDFLHANCSSTRQPPEWNQRTVQGLMSSACGQYCVYYLVFRCRGWPMQQIVNSLPNKPFVSDSYVTAFINKHMRLKTEAFETDVIVNQFCSLFGV
jgi:hypothetical protein